MKCDVCGAPVEDGKCTYCGKIFNKNNILGFNQTQNYQQNVGQTNITPPQNIVVNNTIQTKQVHLGKRKDKYVSLLLCIFLGYFGAHKFYEGKNGMGIVYFFTMGLFGIGWIADIIIIATKKNPYYV